MARPKKAQVELVDKQDNSDDRGAIISAITGDLKKRYGSKIIRTSSDKIAFDERRAKKNVISTGSINFDALFGVGGLPIGRVLEVRGKHGRFKTGLLLSIGANAQKQGFFFVFLDFEHRLDLDRAEKLGVNLDEDKFMLITPETGESGLAALESVVKSLTNVYVVIDSVSAMLPESDLKKAIDGGNHQMGSQAKLISEALKRLVSAISKSNSILAFTNQFRTMMAGVFTYQGASGGKALPYYNSYIMEVKWADDGIIKDDEGLQVGQLIEIYFEKNSTDFPKRSRLCPVHLADGIWKEYELLLLGIEHGIIEKNGGYYSVAIFNEYGDVVIEEDKVSFEKGIQGKNSFLNYLRENPNVMVNLDTFIRKALGIYQDEN